MGQEENIPQLHLAIAVILRQLIGVELPQGSGQPDLDLFGKRPLAVLPVKCKKFGRLICPLESFGNGLAYNRTSTLGQFDQHKQWNSSQMMNASGLNCQGCSSGTRLK
jgi:hypothetical protein